MYSQALQQRLNDIAHRYRDQIHLSLNQILNQPKYKNTGAGVASLTVDVVEATQNKAPEIRISFADHLNLIDKRKMQFTGLPPVEDFTQWAETRNLTGPVPGYKNGAPNLPPWKVAQRRAWAIAKSKQKFDTHKPKPWRKKGLGTVLKEMNQVVLLEFEKTIEQYFQASIDKGLKI